MQTIEQYILEHSSIEDPILADLNRETHLKVLLARMISGPIQGKFLEMISQMVQPLHILEVGTFTGYSTICLSRGLRPGGHIDTIDINDEIAYLPRKYFARAGISQQVNQHLGNSKDIIPTLNKTYDLIFLDGDKRQYATDYCLAVRKLKPGGYIIADNVLWYGKVISEPDDEYTRGIVKFNKLVKNDSRVEQVILPLRDGLMFIRKKQ